jgi:hypothetical protein
MDKSHDKLVILGPPYPARSRVGAILSFGRRQLSISGHLTLYLSREPPNPESVPKKWIAFSASLRNGRTSPSGNDWLIEGTGGQATRARVILRLRSFLMRKACLLPCQRWINRLTNSLDDKIRLDRRIGPNSHRRIVGGPRLDVRIHCW